MSDVYIPRDPTKHMRQKRSKYRNKRVKAMGKSFDSIKERDRYFFLRDAQQRGEIRNLQAQVRFNMVVCGERICSYVADFTYNVVVDLGGGHEFNTELVVEDVKSVPTAKLSTFVIKSKLMKALHGVEIRIVKSPTEPIA